MIKRNCIKKVDYTTRRYVQCVAKEFVIICIMKACELKCWSLFILNEFVSILKIKVKDNNY